MFVPASLTAACLVPGEATGSSGTGGASAVQCETSFDCSSGEGACQQWACVQHQCVAQDAPAGTIPGDTSVNVPPCHRLVCDGDGGESVEVDPGATPPQDGVVPCQKAVCDATGQVVTVPDPTAVPPDDMPGDCQRPACDASGNVISTPDPTDLPTDSTGDCRKPACDASGTPTFTPDPSDLPPSTPGDCKSAGCDASGNITYTPDPSDVPPDTIKGDCLTPGCDANGNATSVPANDPPPASACDTYTCQSGQAVSSPVNQGKSCGVDGFVCSATGTCDVCPAADATCSDPGPGAGAGSLASAYDLGTIGFCDGDGYSFCGALHARVTSYVGYVSDGSFSLCEFDPDVRVQASAPVTLCEYFDCPTVTCPAGTLPATLTTPAGLPGCCATGAAVEMQISPSCEDSQTYITVESEAGACTTYELFFHS